MTHRQPLSFLLTPLMLCLAVATLQANEISYRTVAFSDDSAPGAGGAIFDGFPVAVIDESGGVSFVGSLAGADVNINNGVGIWSEDDNILRLVARAGDAAPGAGTDQVFGRVFSSVNRNKLGRTAFRGSIANAETGTIVANAIWSEGSGPLRAVAVDGEAAPGTDPGVRFRVFSNPVFNTAGETAFHSALTVTGSPGTPLSGVFSDVGGTLAPVALQGEPAPGLGGDVVFGDAVSTPANPTLNDAGFVAFFRRLAGTGVNNTNNQSIWVADDGGPQLVARTGQPAPGTGPGVVFSLSQVISDAGFFEPKLNAAGRVAFLAFVNGPMVDATNEHGIWSDRDGMLDLVVRTGDPAPGADAGVVFTGFLGAPVLNGAGEIAFRGNLTGPAVDAANDSGLWLDDGDTFARIAREGDTAPGVSPGLVFGAFNGNPALNAAGQVAFRGFLTGSGVNAGNDEGIWVAEPNGELKLVVRERGLFDVDDDPMVEDLRTILSINGIIDTGGEDGRATNFNDVGQVALNLTFTDGSAGIFIASTIPEPCSLAHLVLGGLALWPWRRRWA